LGPEFRPAAGAFWGENGIVRGATRLISVHRGAFDGTVDLGHEPPLRIGEKPEEKPVTRSVSPRWLAGTILTGLTSIFLMGGALMVALNGSGQFASVPDTYTAADDEEPANAQFGGGKGDRIEPLQEEVSSRQILQVSTVTRQGERDFIKLRPFAKVTASLVAPKPELAAQIPAYDALRIFADNSAPEAPVTAGATAGADQIYGANVDGEVSVKTSAFPIDNPDLDSTSDLPTAEVEQVVRAAANLGIEPGSGDQTAALPYADAGNAGEGEDPFSAMGVKITAENVSNVAKSDSSEAGSSIEEKMIAVTDDDDFRGLLEKNAVDPGEAGAIAGAMSGLVDVTHLRSTQRLRIAYASDPATGASRPVRVSIYENGAHQATVARADNNGFVRADEPNSIMADSEADKPDTFSGGLPRLYDAVYETALEQQIPTPLIDQLIRIFAFDVDFQSRITPGDSLEVFHSLPDPQDKAANDPEVLFAALTLGGVTKKFYRFRTSDDGIVDYYDEEGKSAKKFLMRKPMGVGIIRSGFGWRVHPILGYRRLHAGVDYAAPKGTPIFAAGSGVVEKAGRSSGYGNLTVIQHTNGYETAYGHQSAFAKGIVPGARVRQGQIIGYVGSTGLSTGPHLHFEIRVNAKPVDPLRIRLPRGRVLQAELLNNFEHERDRIDTLLGAPSTTPAKVASTN
jgi:murein DD-endopeptidase MepM/ murein hydrolase activator NlpD